MSTPKFTSTEQDNVLAFKNLAAALLEIAIDKVEGETISDVVNFIAQNYTKSSS